MKYFTLNTAYVSTGILPKYANLWHGLLWSLDRVKKFSQTLKPMIIHDRGEIPQFFSSNEHEIGGKLVEETCFSLVRSEEPKFSTICIHHASVGLSCLSHFCRVERTILLPLSEKLLCRPLLFPSGISKMFSLSIDVKDLVISATCKISHGRKVANAYFSRNRAMHT